MIITNKFNIPEIIVRSMGESWPPKKGRVSVTALIDSPLIRYLRIKYWDELQEDTSDRLWALLGSAAHTVIQRGRSHTDKVEEYLKIFVNGMEVTGKSDIIIDHELIDLKITSVYSFLLGEKEAWNKQINVYNYMCGKQGIKINSAKIYGILRDWESSKLLKNRDYPEIPFFQHEITLWPDEKTQAYIEARVELHAWADECLELGEEATKDLWCTPAERWLRPTTYAVKKGKNKIATKVCSTMEAAEKWIEGKLAKENAKKIPKLHPQIKINFSIETRQGAAIRCERFCNLRGVCPVYQQVAPQERIDQQEQSDPADLHEENPVKKLKPTIRLSRRDLEK